MKKLLIILLIVGCNNSTESNKHGCLDSQATNYDATASINNNYCTYIDSCGVIDIDKTNDCVQDGCGVWDGDGSSCCEGNSQITCDEGERISPNYQTMKFDFCYPSDSLESTFSFSMHSGKVFMITISATWDGPAFNYIPEGDEIYQHWENDDRVEILHFLDDIDEPFTCSQWGHQGVIDIPPIVDDGVLNPVRGWFPIDSDSDSQFPITIFLDHNMQVVSNQFVSLSKDDANYFIEQMLDAM